jgi:hypothetical protein
MDPRLPYRNIPKKLCISFLHHAVIWLGLVLLSPPPLLPSPLPSSLLTIPPLVELSEHINEVYLVE